MRDCRHFLIATFLLNFVASIAAQRLSVGVIGGAGATQDFQDQRAGPPYSFVNYSTPKRYIFGATLEYRSTSRFSVELDGIYHPLRYTFAGIEPDGSLNSVSPASVITWEFPVLAKYRFSFAGAHPFLEAGPSFRTAGNLNSANPTHAGFTAGAGIETRWRGLNISPVIRYTRWAAEGNDGSVKTVPDQLELLVGFSGGTSSNWHPLGGRVSFGAVAGVSLTPDFRSQIYQYHVIDGPSVQVFSGSGPRSFLRGAMLEVALPGKFSIEGDVIYDPLKSSTRTVPLGTPVGLLPGAYEYASPEWRFPVLAKLRLRGERIQPLVELGPSFRLPEGQDFSKFGATAGLGLETHWRRMKIAPVVRYTRWGPEKFPDFASGIRNQVEFLTGFSF